MPDLTPITRVPGRHVTGSREEILAWLHDERVFGLAAEVAVTAAAHAPGWYGYTPDGCCWVRARPDGDWEAGDSSDAEMRLAHDRRRATVMDRIDPDTVTAGDRITWRYRSWPSPEMLAGTAEYATREAVHVTTPGGYQAAVGWHLVTGHQPREASDA